MSLGDKPHSFVSLGIADISRFPKLSIYSETVLLKTFLRQFESCFYCRFSKSYEVL